MELDNALLKDPDPDVRGAASLLRHEMANIHTMELATWLGSPQDWSDAWDHASDLSDASPPRPGR